MVAGSCAYCAQAGVGTADPIHSSCVSAGPSPGAPAAAQDAPRQRPPPPPGFGGERPRETDSRRNVHLTRDAVGADAEQGIEGAVVGWRAPELRRLEAGAIGELQPGARAPRVAQV